MARIKGRSAQDTRRAILRSARQAFAARGYVGASVGRIARGAGVTPAALAYHWGDKRGLHTQVIDQIYEDLATLATDAQVPRDLDAFVAWIWDRVVERREAVRVLLRAIVERGGLGEELRRTRALPALELAQTLVAQRFDVPPRRARHAIVAFMQLVVRLATNDPDDNQAMLATDDAAATRRAVVDLLTITARGLLFPSPPMTPGSSP